MICFPNAKINIGLNITSKRDDGFHEIESIFYPLRKLNDVLEVIENIDNSNIEFTSSGIQIPGNSSDNLCVKAYNLIQQFVKVPPIKIHLHKYIAIGAGMGGGSSDAAFFIQLVNLKFSLNLSYEVMHEIAKNIGSDCAFFLENKPCFATGRGENLEQINLDLSGKKIVIIYPNIHISTKEAYAGVVPKAASYNLKQAIEKPIENWKNEIKNDFETSIFIKYPQLLLLKEKMYEHGAQYASMSGSGSTIFGIFDNSITNTDLNFNLEYQLFEL